MPGYFRFCLVSEILSATAGKGAAQTNSFRTIHHCFKPLLLRAITTSLVLPPLGPGSPLEGADGGRKR